MNPITLATYSDLPVSYRGKTLLLYQMDSDMFNIIHPNGYVEYLNRWNLNWCRSLCTRDTQPKALLEVLYNGPHWLVEVQ